MDEARRKLLEQLASGQAPDTQAAPGGLPPGVAEQAGFQPYPASLTIPHTGMRMNFPKPAAVAAQEQAAKNANPTLTETERERGPMSQSAVKFLDQFAAKLGLNPQTQTMSGGKNLASPLIREVVPQKFQDYAMSEDSSMLYNDLESAFQLGAVVLTGRQGDIGKLQQLRDVYSFGAGIKDKPKLANQRYQNLRKLFQTFDRSQQLPEEQRQAALDAASRQMDQLMGEADPNIATLQKQFPGATIRRK